MLAQMNHQRPLKADSKKGRLSKKKAVVIIMYFDAIAKIVSERTGCDVSSVKPESTFSELGIDSLDTVEMLMDLEEELNVELEIEEKVTTIGELVAFIEAKIG